VRPLAAALTALVLAAGGAACGDTGELEETLDDVGDAVSEAATEAADAIGDAASEVSDTAREAADLVGFCDAARRVEAAVEDRNAGDALEAAEDLVAEAPDDVRDEAATVRDGVQAWHDGDRETIEDEDFRSAVEDVATYAEERCDPTS
jgi:hypothetical protein